MFFKVLLLALFVVATVADETVEQKWQKFKQEHNRNYDVAEDTKRFEIFKKTLESIEAHNKDFQAGKSTYELGINDFADKTEEELAQSRGLKKN